MIFPALPLLWDLAIPTFLSEDDLSIYICLAGNSLIVLDFWEQCAQSKLELPQAKDSDSDLRLLYLSVTRRIHLWGLSVRDWLREVRWKKIQQRHFIWLTISNEIRWLWTIPSVTLLRFSVTWARSKVNILARWLDLKTILKYPKTLLEVDSEMDFCINEHQIRRLRGEFKEP
jgi:hypothetical protein